MISIADANMSLELLGQVAEYSRRYLSVHGLSLSGSPWGRKTTSPKTGAILHYTASDSLLGTVRWFCDPALNPKGQESAHFVIGNKTQGTWAAKYDDLSLFSQLGVEIVQLRPLTAGANHAPLANDWAYGIETVNLGLAAAGAAPDLEHYWGRYWQRYAVEQIDANITLLQALRSLPASALTAERILGHEQVEMASTPVYGRDKRDPGPAFPLTTVRRTAFAGQGVSSQTTDMTAAEIIYTRPYSPRPFVSAVSFTARADGADADALGRTLLRGLQYDWHDDVSLRDVVGIFQKAAGLRDDGVIGPITYAALRARFQDRYQQF